MVHILYDVKGDLRNTFIEMLRPSIEDKYTKNVYDKKSALSYLEDLPSRSQNEELMKGVNVLI